MPNNLVVILIAIFMATPFATVASARGRSFPSEITGTIQHFDRPTQTFILKADQPAKTLKIGLRDDCKFLDSGKPAGAEVLRKGMHLRVSYFATIFTGNLAVEIEADPKAKSVHGVIKKIEPTNRRLTLSLDNSREFVVQWTTNAHFINDGRVIRPETLTEGAIAYVSYYSPAFGARYAVTVETVATPDRVKKNSR